MEVSDHGRTVRKRFVGRRLSRFDQQADRRQSVTEIFTFRKGKYVLHQRSMLLWRTASDRVGDQWTSPAPNQSVSRSMAIFDTLSELTAQLPPALAAEVAAAAETGPIEDLDI
ncbi:EXLDI protein [Bifidobacterium actinocoloniiforme]|uniref:EXLDI protein n=1 Tax=Bifidobacterium actinocoloniiforme TaxID=638619 RepID=UPI001F432855|nr:EXLDI protein [Bifidobacterium actinocoloniiforme]